MKSKSQSSIAAIGGALFIAFAASQTAYAATLTWDPADTGNGTTIDPGDGIWSLSAGNLWNNAGTNEAWTQTSATSPLHSSVFAGADGTYAIIVGEAVATQNLTFSNSGYTLSAASALNLRAAPASGNGIISVASGKSATIGTNVSVVRVGAGTISGGGILNITGTGATVRIAAGGNSMTVSGSTVNVGAGGTFSCTSSMIVGNNATAAAVNVNGGNVTVTGEVATGVLVIANTTAAGSAVFTLTSGAVLNNSISGGLRFGSTSANTASSTFHLDGGILTVARVFEGEAGHTSTFNLNGGTIKTRTGTTTAATFMEGIDTVNVRNGGVIFDTNGVDTTVGQALAHSAIGGDNANDGGLTKDGPGTLSLTGANTYTGITKVNAGTLAVNGSSINNSNRLTIDGGQVQLTGAETVGTLYFGATQQAAGTWGSSSSSAVAPFIDDARFTGSGTLIVTSGTGGSGYTAWQSANGTTQAADLDHDTDGVPNGVEHFLGGVADTTGFTTPLPGVDNNLGTLSVTWIRHPDFAGFPGNYGTAFVVETSATLANPWTPAVEGIGEDKVEITGNNVKYTFPAGTRNFARLKVVVIP